VNISLSIRCAVKDLSYRIAPRSFARLRLRAIRRKYPEPELRLLPALIPKRSHFVDIGANAGVYSLHALQYVASVSAFEPLFEADSELSTLIRVLGLPVTVHAVALSNEAGLAEMRIVEEAAGLSTIETRNQLAYAAANHVSKRKVPRQTLDHFKLRNVSLIKIDVEGHELRVLEGSEVTLAETRAAVLVEAEDRHNRGIIDGLNAFFNAREYNGFFLADGVLHSMADFRLNIHQNTSDLSGWESNWQRHGTYVNNFLYVPQERWEAVKQRLAVHCRLATGCD
jgi:FkbM family methyltransferase